MQAKEKLVSGDEYDSDQLHDLEGDGSQLHETNRVLVQYEKVNEDQAIVTSESGNMEIACSLATEQGMQLQLNAPVKSQFGTC